MGSPELLLGIDVGTTACKAAAITLDGVEVAHGRAPMPWRPVPTGAEIDPPGIIEAALAAANAALDALEGGRVLGIGVCSVAETGILIDAAGHPVLPAIAWHDTRGTEEAAELVAEVGTDRFVARTGLPPTPLCSAVKYRWFRRHAAATGSATRWLNVAEWVVHCLGGGQHAELSLASRTGFLDLATRAWCEETLAWAQAPEGLLPTPLAAGTPWGIATGEVAGPRLAEAVLTVAGQDHLCAAVGAGAADPAAVFDSCGTAEALVRAVAPMSREAVARAVVADITVGWHVVPGHHALVGAQRAGLALQRFLDLLGVDDSGRAALEERALSIGPGAVGLRVLDAEAEAATLAGIGRAPSPAQVWRAAVEAVVVRGHELFATLALLGGEVERVVMSGGWSQSPTLLAAKRERFGARLEIPNVAEAGARGAALLAGCAAGVYTGVAALRRPSAQETQLAAIGGATDG